MENIRLSKVQKEVLEKISQGIELYWENRSDHKQSGTSLNPNYPHINIRTVQYLVKKYLIKPTEPYNTFHKTTFVLTERGKRLLNG